jgi:hypothetical protein
MNGPEPLPELESLDLPETFVLYHGPDSPQALQRLFSAWSWAAGSLGEYYPLLLLGFGERARAGLSDLTNQYGLGETVHAIPNLPPASLAGLYRRCAAVFHPAPPSPWEGPLRFALATARPLVALETPLTGALTGPAAYLVDPGQPPERKNRALGAALITVIVEESVAEALSAAAVERTAGWQPDAYQGALGALYQSFL